MRSGAAALVLLWLWPFPSFAAAPSDPTFQATLTRSLCLYDCPAYEVTITADGRVTFTGYPAPSGPSVTCLGKHRWRVPGNSVAALEAAIDAQDFYSLKDDYTAKVWDLPTYAVTVTRMGRTKHVSDYAGRAVGMPTSMTHVENAIDHWAATRYCVGRPDASG
jgi:hypothetical protein